MFYIVLIILALINIFGLFFNEDFVLFCILLLFFYLVYSFIGNYITYLVDQKRVKILERFVFLYSTRINVIKLTHNGIVQIKTFIIDSKALVNSLVTWFVFIFSANVYYYNIDLISTKLVIHKMFIEHFMYNLEILTTAVLTDKLSSHISSIINSIVYFKEV
jgi:hypothetical protein